VQPSGSGTPQLVACAHGTRDPAGRQAVDELRCDVAAARPEVGVVEAYVDVQEPALPDVLRGLESAVVVPILLSAGFHVHVDVAAAVDAAGPDVRAAKPLGPDPALVDVLALRLGDAGLDGDHAVLLAAAGSSDLRAVLDVERTAMDLAARLDRAVTPVYASAAEPRVESAVAELRTAGRRVAVASYLLAPGHFHHRLRATGADVVAAPLLPHPSITALVLRRYDEALSPPR
jgi:sirohydrochlorin ferrochelatase